MESPTWEERAGNLNGRPCKARGESKKSATAFHSEAELLEPQEAKGLEAGQHLTLKPQCHSGLRETPRGRAAPHP